MGATEATFNWEISEDSGATWTSMGKSGPHTLYWTWGDPILPPFLDINGNVVSGAIYDLALEKSCGKVAKNMLYDITQPHGICANIMGGIAKDIKYHPNTPVTGHPLLAYSATSAHCLTNARLLQGLLRTIGLHGELYLVYGGVAGTRQFYSNGPFRASFRLNVGKKDYAPAQPHFSYHAVVRCLEDVEFKGVPYLDPSYGVAYSLFGLQDKCLEVAYGPPTKQRKLHLGNSWPVDANTSWTCPHPGEFY